MGKIHRMPRASLTFAELNVRRMYGESHDGLHVRELSPGLNIVYGPNAAGKSTLGRAIERILWTDRDDATSMIEALFRFDGVRWRADLESGRVRFERDGAPAERPPLASSDHAGRYHLDLHELLSASGPASRSFARAIMKEAAGGVDVKAAASTLGFRAVRPSSGKLTRAANDAWSDVTAALDRQQTLRADERRLGSLREELQRARDARDRVDFLTRLLEYFEARESASTSRSHLETFEPVLKQMTGDEPGRLEALRAALAESERDVAEAHDRIAELEARRDGSVVHKKETPENLIGGMRLRVDLLEKHESDIRTLQAELAADRQKCRDAWERLHHAFDSEAARRANAEGIGRLADFVQTAERLRARAASLEEQIAYFASRGEADDGFTTDETSCREAVRILARWLASSFEEEPSLGRSWTHLLVVASLVVGAGAVGMLVPEPLVAGVIVAVIAAAGAVLAYRLAMPGKEQPDERARLAEDYHRLGIDPPDSWAAEPVSSLLEKLHRELDGHLDGSYARKRVSELEHKLEQIRREREALTEERAQIAERLGIGADVREEELYLLVESLRQWQVLDDQVRSREAALASHRTQASDLREKIGEKLAPFGFPACEDAPHARACLTELSDAIAAYQRNGDALAELERGRRKAHEAVTRCRREIDEIFAGLDLEPGDDAGLHHLSVRLGAYRDAREEVIRAEAWEHGALERLQAMPPYDERDRERTPADVRRELEQARSAADRADRLSEEVSRIEADIRNARHDHTLEDRRARHVEALELLRLKREEDFRAVAGSCLAEFIRQRTRDEQLPAVFHRAREIFAEITRDRYRLDINADGDQFAAYDNVIQRGRTLDQLSSGTRVQLLLSVRLAFLEQQEQGVMAPLVLDETLANSDDGKAEEIIHAIVSICRTGRQVFYFTAQQDEVQRWQAALEDQDLDHRFVPLGNAPDPAEIDAEALPAPVWDKSVPDPDGLSYAEYGSILGVPRWDFRSPVESIHLWYLIEDVHLLHRLLTAGFERWGALEQLCERGGGAMVGIEPEVATRMKLCARALSVWQEGWTIGRGMPVDRSVLIASGAVTDTFIDRVSDLCIALDGDGKALIRALREGGVSRFQSSKIDELEAFLQDSGYIDTRSTLPTEELWAMAMASITREARRTGTGLVHIQAVLERIASPGLSETPALTGRAAGVS